MYDLFIELARHPFKTINSRKELRYLVAGTTSEGIEYVSFLILYTLFPHFLYITNSISFGLGVISGFVFHKLWSFRGEHQFKTHQQFIGYISLATINFVLINLLVGLLVDGMRMPAFVAKFVAIAITVIWTFTLSNFVIFRQRTH